MKGIEFTVARLFFLIYRTISSVNAITLWILSLSELGFALNPDCSICINCCESPWLFAIFRLCFAEYTFFFIKIFILYFVIIVNASIILALVATISQLLPVLSNFMPVSPKRNFKEHILSKTDCAW
jgi:hypothetical protein